ncbi:MAG TPA: hypothetical protein PKZ56_02725 [Candidatus Paceibacterota bacterium]|nr:hypothetical protein [Candidatus Paceibacterota bacterium]
MATINIDELKEAARRVLTTPKLRTIFESLADKESLQYLLLSDQDKTNIAAAFVLSKKYDKDFSDVISCVSDAEYLQICMIEHDKLINKIIYDDSFSLKDILLNNKSRDYKPFVRSYVVPGKPVNGVRVKNILYLNRTPECYQFNGEIKKLIDEMYSRGMFGSIILSATTMDARMLLETQKVDAIFNNDWSKFSVRNGKEDILQALNCNPLDGKKYNILSFDNYFMSLPMNPKHNDFYGFFDEMKKGRYTQQGVLHL